MDFDAYQRAAIGTDQVPGDATAEMGKAIIVPLLGLAGEAGELLSEYKKHLRDGEAYVLFSERVAEELGDLLWYISNVATKFGLSLEEIAAKNLSKVRERWVALETSHAPFDSKFPSDQQLPRRFEVELADEHDGERVLMRAVAAGQQMGDPLGDNSYAADGYRFHDVFHLAYAAVLGWSPVTRKNLGRKRKADARVDEVEDGGRAAVLEEGISAMVFNYARDHSLLEGVTSLDYDLLRTIKRMTAGLEVSVRSTGEWERAIFQGYHVFRQVLMNRGGRISVDLDAREIRYLGAAGTPRD